MTIVELAELDLAERNRIRADNIANVRAQHAERVASHAPAAAVWARLLQLRGRRGCMFCDWSRREKPRLRFERAYAAHLREAHSAVAR